MSISARSRRGTSPSFWRSHNAMQTMMVEACMSSLRPVFPVKADHVQPVAPVAPVWSPTPEQRDRYQVRRNRILSLSSAR